jgi:hypothetical protein
MGLNYTIFDEQSFINFMEENSDNKGELPYRLNDTHLCIREINGNQYILSYDHSSLRYFFKVHIGAKGITLYRSFPTKNEIRVLKFKFHHSLVPDIQTVLNIYFILSNTIHLSQK